MRMQSWSCRRSPSSAIAWHPLQLDLPKQAQVLVRTRFDFRAETVKRDFLIRHWYNHLMIHWRSSMPVTLGPYVVVLALGLATTMAIDRWEEREEP